VPHRSVYCSSPTARSAHARGLTHRRLKSRDSCAKPQWSANWRCWWVSNACADELDTLSEPTTPVATRGAARSCGDHPRRRRGSRDAAAATDELVRRRAGGAGRVPRSEPDRAAIRWCHRTDVQDLSRHANPRWYQPDRIVWVERRLPRTLAQGTRFVGVSDVTAVDLRRQLGVAVSRIDVVRPGVSTIFRPLARKAAAPSWPGLY
jgi:hypothetical protein